MQIERKCIVCDKCFTALPHAIKIGKALYCSKSCASKNKHGNKSFEQRFWEKVNKREPNECWTWTGATQAPWHYGSFQRGIGSDGKSHSDVAHRVSYELTYGCIQKGLFVCHRCDNPRCVNPNHLFLGTHTDNMRDMHQKRRGMQYTKPERITRGEHQHLAKLTSDDIKAIRATYQPGKAGHSSDMSIGALARKYHVSKSTMNSIIKRETWKHI